MQKPTIPLLAFLSVRLYSSMTVLSVVAVGQTVTPDGDSPYHLRAKKEHLKGFRGLSPESKGHNLALTVLYVPYLLDSGEQRGWYRR